MADIANEFEPAKIYAALIESGSEWADAEHGAAILEETKSSVLAQLKTEAGAKSDAAAETQAKADPRYREHLEAMVNARRVANLARVRYDAAKVLAEARRTESANRRAEMHFVQQGSAG